MRLVTRSDFDGIVCAALLKKIGVVDDLLFTHPKDIQDGKIEITSNDILTNVPYVKGCGMWFDHHGVNLQNAPKDFKGAFAHLASAARVVWNHYGKEERFGGEFIELMQEVDKIDSANLTLHDVLEPQAWILLGFIMDPRTGLGRFHDFNISNYQLMLKFVDLIQTKSLAEILADPDVRQRVERYNEEHAVYLRMLRESLKLENNVIILDLRLSEKVYVGNRFLLYALHPDASASINVNWGLNKEVIALSVGRSIFNNSLEVDIGQLLDKFGGGGHPGAGTCQLAPADLESKLGEIIAVLNKNTA